MTILLALFAGGFLGFAGFCVGCVVGRGWGIAEGIASVPEPDAAFTPILLPSPEPEPEAFALDSDYLYALDAWRYAVLGPDKTRDQMPAVVS